MSDDAMRLPSYPKVLALGTRGTERLLEGPVVVQEKIDGSQLRVGIMGDGTLTFASRNQRLYPGAAGMFEPVVQHVLSRKEALMGVHRCLGDTDLILYGEYLAKPRQNTLCYQRVPRGNLVLFDRAFGGLGVEHGDELITLTIADALGCEVVPTLHTGPASMDDLKALLEAEPLLGGPMIEGLVVKNYAEHIQLGSQVYPLFCKLVNDMFREKHAANPDWKSGKAKEQEYYSTYRTEARWLKAVQHLRDEGKLLDAPQDIGPLLRELSRDLLEEEGETIREDLFRMHVKDLLRTAGRGLPEWYKERLAEGVEGVR